MAGLGHGLGWQTGSPAFRPVRHRFPVTMKSARVILFALCLPWLASLSRAAEPVLPLRTNDVIAFIGGANMVALAQSGHLETLLTLRHPHHKLRFRSLAWEGDTVFAQPRDVNYPDLVTQLKQVGATVAFVQFGQMESLAGEAGLTNFVEAYEALLAKLWSVTQRVVLLTPHPVLSKTLDRPWDNNARHQDLIRYSREIHLLAKRSGAQSTMGFEALTTVAGQASKGFAEDGNLLGAEGIEFYSEFTVMHLLDGRLDVKIESDAYRGLRSAIAEKSRLWFDYARPSNWAFLAGDRTEQAFSRDYRDRNIRAFAQEMQQFLPLIADAEKRIDELAANAAAEKDTTR